MNLCANHFTAFRIALNMPALPSEFDILFECVRPTVWETAMAEGIDLESDFYWVANNPDEESLEVLERRGLKKRLIFSSALDSPEAIASVQFQLDTVFDHGGYADQDW